MVVTVTINFFWYVAPSSLEAVTSLENVHYIPELSGLNPFNLDNGFAMISLYRICNVRLDSSI